MLCAPVGVDGPGLLCAVTITTDQEAAINTGLELSVLAPGALRIDCGLHFMWSLATQKIVKGEKGRLGLPAARLWRDKMQYADGPKAFEGGADELIVRDDWLPAHVS